jgi:hypothetical protein
MQLIGDWRHFGSNVQNALQLGIEHGAFIGHIDLPDAGLPVEQRLP